jgi:hypothetical protein
MQRALVIFQVMAVIFLALHDWVPLGTLNNVAGLRAVDTRGKLLSSTVVSTVPFAAVLCASIHYMDRPYPAWLIWWLWATYIAVAYGILRAWWIPYLGSPDPQRAARYRVRFAGTHGFLPVRNGIRPDTLHVAFHALVGCILFVLAVLTFDGGG